VRLVERKKEMEILGSFLGYVGDMFKGYNSERSLLFLL